MTFKKSAALLRWLHPVRSSTQAIELWRLREELFDALDDACGERTSLHRQEIKRQLANAVLT